MLLLFCSIRNFIINRLRYAFSLQAPEQYILSILPALNWVPHISQVLFKIIIPDNLKSAVTKASRYEAEVNQTFNDFANHYSATVMPTRSGKPKDKALIENAVRTIYSRIFAPLRNEVFFHLEDLNKDIKEKLIGHNNQNFQGEKYSRWDRFEESEKQALSTLPAQR